MAPPLFGVTIDNVRATYFPTITGFSANTKPTDAAVTIMLNDSAAALGAAMIKKNLNPTSISADAGVTSPIGYQRCQEIIRLWCAVKASDAIQQKDSKLVERWWKQVQAFLADLNVNGYAALGDVPKPSLSAVGPRTHIDELSLKINSNPPPSGGQGSDASPVFLKEDQV